MMGGGIFLIDKDRGLVKMEEAAYDSEALLQELLEKYPDLLAGDQVNPEDPRCWLLVAREMKVSSDVSFDRWSVDHLFLDQDGIPTLVEVKRSSDTRIRREVVGQMLDYAANAVIHWPIEKLRAKFEEQFTTQDQEADVALQEFLDSDEADVEEFWQKVKTNLQAGKVRMVFVADVIPPELKRIVEFLNEQMDPAEVIAVEIRQYVGEGIKSLVPRVIGQTQEAARRKGRVEKRKWNEQDFLQDLETKKGKDITDVARRILEWAKERQLKISWGEGVSTGSFFPVFDYKGEDFWPIAVRSNGLLAIEFKHIKDRPVFDSEEKRLEMLDLLNQIEGVDLSKDAINRLPRIPMERLQKESEFKEFISILDWYLDQIQSNH